MSVFGVDFGCLNSTVAVTRNGGVDVILNEVSKRETSTFVSLGDDERFLGESGLDKAVRKAKDTVGCIKRFIGARASDPSLEAEKRFIYCDTSADKDDRLMFDLNYNGETKSFYPEQILAMFLGQLSRYVDREAVADGAVTGTHVKDCVITVPCWYTMEQRKLVIQACEIANLNCMSLINETSAAGIDYGIFRGTSLPEKEEDAQTVAIVDVGYSCATVTIANFWKGNMKVLTHAADKQVGTRELDYYLAEHFAEEIKSKYKVDVKSNSRARVRLLQACEKLKTLLSGNQIAPLNIENLMDIDVNIQGFKREEMETACAAVFNRLSDLCATAIAAAGVEKGKIHKVEFIGGGCRVPLFKQTVGDAFGQPPSFTLNASESVARGTAITAAVYSPKFKVREFVIHEAPLRPVLLGYHSDKATAVSSVSFLPQVNKVLTILGLNDRYPKTFELTFDRTESFDLHMLYDEEKSEDLKAAKAPLHLGQVTIGDAGSKKTNGKVVVAIKFSANGLVSVDGAHTTEIYEVEEVVEQPKKKDGEAKEGEADEKPEKTTVKKEKTRRVVLSVTPKHEVLGLASQTVLNAAKQEKEMAARDTNIIKTKEAKNALESYIYDYRAGIQEGGKYAPFVTSADQSKFVELANKFEEWLYDEGCDSTFEEYDKRHNELMKIGEPALRRFRLHEEIPFALKQHQQKLEALKKQALEKVGKHAWITEEELKGAAAKCDEAAALGDKQLEEYLAAPKPTDPLVTPQSFADKYKEVEAAVKAVMNKPAPPPPKKEEPKKEEEKKPDATPADGDAAPPAAEESNSPKGPTVDKELD